MINTVRKHFPLFAIGFFFVVAVSITLYDSQMSTDPEEWKLRGDLTEYSLAASWVMLDGGNAYDRAVHPYNNNYKYFPLNATVLVPLGLLPIPMAQGLWVAINACLLLFALWTLKELAGRERLNILFWIVAFLISGRFMIDNIQLGQWNLPVFSLTVIGLWLMIARRRTWSGGAVIGLAAGLKYMPAGFAIYFLARRQWKSAIAVLCGMVLWILILPSLVWGPSRHIEMLGNFVEKSRESTENMIGRQIYVGHSLLVFVKSSLTDSVHHPIHGVYGRKNIVDWPEETAGAIAFGLCFLAALATFLAVGRGGRVEPGLRTLLDISAIFALLLMVSPEMRKAQMLTMYVPSFSLILAFRYRPKGSAARRIALSVLVLAFVAMFASSDHGDAWEHTQEWLALHGSWTLYILTFWLGCILVRLREEKTDSSLQSQEKGKAKNSNADGFDQACQAD
ncbi:MAG: glycosyltransferase family 87 protein [Candidatus Sumerlaeota bacterium]